MRCQVAIIGAGPAGLTLAHMLYRQGIDTVVIERSSREHVESRVRAGIIEQVAFDLLTDLGVGARMNQQALVHDGFYLRFDQHTHHLDFHTNSGRHSYVYGQSELVRDLIDARIATGQPLLFDASNVTLSDIAGARPTVSFVHEGRTTEITADFIAGCDGFHGVSRTALPAGYATQHDITYPVAWLGILARTSPVTAEGMYSVHQDGLSVHSMRSTTLTRQYLQVAPDTTLDEWPNDRIWKELQRRSASVDHPPLEQGEIIERGIAHLRAMVLDRLQFGSLYLLGDAAHIVPPTGAKGLNLALSDAGAMSYALGAYYRTGDRSHLDSYTHTVMPRIWQVQDFCATMTAVLHRLSDDPMEWQLRRARMQRWVDSPAERDALGEVYFGLPYPTPWRFE